MQLQKSSNSFIIQIVLLFIIKLTRLMIENSLISHRDVYAAFTKFQRVSSDHKFRTKSIRVKTISNEMQDHLTQKLGLPVIYNNHSQIKLHTNQQSAKLLPNLQSNLSIERGRAQSYKIIQKNYEEELNSFGVTSQFLKKMFELKCQQTQTKYNEQRYQIFIKNFALRLCKYKHLPINQMGLNSLCLQAFFQWFINWEGHISDVDLSYAADLLKDSKMKIIANLLQNDKKLMKLSLCNSNLDDEQLKKIFRLVKSKEQLFSLDISNINSQSLNRLGDSLNLLNQFLIQNRSVAIFKASNMHIKKQGFQHICKAISTRRDNPLKILSLADNHINGAQLCDHFCSIVRSGLTHLDISANPLGQQFYKNLPILKGATLRQLNLQETSMNSQNLYDFLEKIEECKTLSVLKLDNNDFSHHWFGKIGQKIETNSCLQWISLNNCQIKTFLPLFQGLALNRYLKRLDASNNIIDCDSENPKKIVDCFMFNKNLQEIRLRFCNLNEFLINKIVEGLNKNQKVKLLDISENLLQDTGGNNILKMLEENEKIETIGIEKLQLSQQMRKRIYLKLKENKALRQREQFGKLKSLTTDLKARDGYTWDDVSELEDEDKMLSNKLKITREKVQKLQEIIATKKQKINEIIQKCKQQEKKIQNMLKQKIRLQNQRVRQAQKQANKSSKQQASIKEMQIKETHEIQRLEQKIRQTNQKNKKRQNELQDKLRNLKYLNRKRGKSINVQTLTKRPSGHNHNH